MKNFQTTSLAFLCLFIAGLATGPPSSAGEQKPFEWKLAALAPRYVGWAKHMREIIHPAVERATDGNLKPKWYWGGIMGEDRDYIEKMRAGQLDGAAFTGQGVVLILPEMAVLELPFMFNDYREVDYVRKKMFPSFDLLAEKRGYKIIAWADQDFDQIYSTRYKMNSLEDFQRAKILSWYGPAEHNVLKKLGAAPIPVGVLEISPAIRQKMADTFIAPAVWIVGSQLYTILKYVNPVKIRYSPVAMFVNLETWNRVPDDYKKRLLAIRDREAVDFTVKSRDDSQRALDAMVKKSGVRITGPAPEELALIRKKSREVWYEMAGTDFPAELLDELLGHLADFRSHSGAQSLHIQQ